MNTSDFSLLAKKAFVALIVMVIPGLIVLAGLWLTPRFINPGPKTSNPFPHSAEGIDHHANGNPR